MHWQRGWKVTIGSHALEHRGGSVGEYQRDKGCGPGPWQWWYCLCVVKIEYWYCLSCSGLYVPRCQKIGPELQGAAIRQRALNLRWRLFHWDWKRQPVGQLCIVATQGATQECCFPNPLARLGPWQEPTCQQPPGQMHRDGIPLKGSGAPALQCEWDDF